MVSGKVTGGVLSISFVFKTVSGLTLLSLFQDACCFTPSTDLEWNRTRTCILDNSQTKNAIPVPFLSSWNENKTLVSPLFANSYKLQNRSPNSDSISLYFSKFTPIWKGHRN